MSEARTEPAGSRSVLRALEILDLLAATERPLALAQIAKEFGIPKSSCLALLRALCARDFVRQEPGGAYVLGLRTFEVGAAYLRAVTPVGAATAELRALTERLGMTSHFAVLEGDEVVYLAKQDPLGTGVRLASSLGARLSAWTTAVGKAQLAFRDARPGTGQSASRRGAAPPGLTSQGAPEGRGAVWSEERRGRRGASDEGRRRLKSAPQASENTERARREGGASEAPRRRAGNTAGSLEEVRSRGYAVDEGTTAAGIRCVAAPVFGVGGCCGAVGVSYLMHDGADVPVIADLVVSAAMRVSSELGGAWAAGQPR